MNKYGKIIIWCFQAAGIAYTNCGTVQIKSSDMGVQLYTAFGFKHNISALTKLPVIECRFNTLKQEVDRIISDIS